MSNKYYVRQNGFKDCGPSCLLSILKYYGCEASHEEVTHILKTDKDGTNALNIINGCRLFGFDGYGMHISVEDIINKKIAFPIIAHVLKDNMYHFIVIYNIKNYKLLIMDPSSKIKKLSVDEFKKIYLNTSLFIYPVKNVKAEISKENIFHYLIAFIKCEKSKIIKLIIYSLTVVILGIISNYYSMVLIDYIVPNFNISLLLKITIIFLIIMFTKNILVFIREKNLIEIIKNISIKFNNIVAHKLFNLPYQFFKNKSVGEVTSRMNDLKLFKDIVIKIISNVFVDILLVILSILVLVTINLKLFILYLFEMIIYLIIVLIYRKVLKYKSENILISDGKYNKCLNDNICGYESNINLNLKENILRNLDIRNIDNSIKYSSYSKSLNSEEFIKNLIVDTIYIISIFLSILYIHNNVMTLGEFFLFNAIIFYFTEPLKNILDLEPNIDYAKNIYNRINDLLIYNNRIDDETNETINGDIKISNVSYKYDSLNYLFKNVNLNIKYKDKYLIYGDSGSGKSTLMKIILKYFKEYDGDIFINNINIKDINKNVIANSFTYVSQKSYVINDTLKNNITYFRDIDEKEYEKIISICNLNNLRNSTNFRDNYIIEDDGFNISGGERQKIVLARSLLKNSNFIILDEALSEISFEEEKQIMERIFEEYKNKTIIYISHKNEIINLFSKKYKIRKEKC